MALERGTDVARSPAATPPAPPRDLFWPAFLLCAAVSLVPIWSVTRLPLTDLPQHAAQVFFWQHYDDPQYGIAARAEFQWFSPYLLGYAAWRLLAVFLPIAVGAKVLASLAVLALPCSFLLWFKHTGQEERWWALLGFPLAYGFSFYFGFLNFILALPIGIAVLAWASSYARAPGLRMGLTVALAGFVLFFAHGLVMCFALAISASLVLAHAPNVKAAARRFWPFALWLLPTAAYAVLYIRMREHGEWVGRSWQRWDLGWDRVLFLPHYLIGFPQDWLGAAWVVAVALTAGYVLRPVRAAANWIPSAWALAVVLLSPDTCLGTKFFCYRFASFLPPFLLSGLSPRGSLARMKAVRGTVLALTLFWLAVLSVRFHGFEDEARAFNAVLERLPPQKTVLPLIFDPRSEHVYGLPYLHFATWYEVEKGGRAGFSFVDFGSCLLRNRPGVHKLADEALQITPEIFTWDEYRHFDYFLVRAKEDKSAALFARADVPVECVVQSGEWYLYEPRRETPPNPAKERP